MDFTAIETTGIGINYNTHLAKGISDNRSAFDLIEVITERLTSGTLDTVLEDMLNQFPVALHGVDMSLGTHEPLDPKLIDKLTKICTRYRPRWISEHIAFCRAGDYDIGQLMPVRFTHENC
jgi:uncharacterized protein (UPF0276 family)